MDMPEANLFHKAQCLLPFIIGFTWKSHDDVCGYVEIRYRGPGTLDQRKELAGPAASRHALQYGVRTALYWQVKVGHESGILEQIPEVFRKIPGLQ